MKLVGELELQDSLGILLIFKNIGLSIKCPKYTQSTNYPIFNNYMSEKNFFDFNYESLKLFLNKDLEIEEKKIRWVYQNSKS